MPARTSDRPNGQEGYFVRFKTFEHDEGASLVEEFDRLALDRNWSSKRYQKEKQKCFAEEFHHHFGKDQNKLDS